MMKSPVQPFNGVAPEFRVGFESADIGLDGAVKFDFWIHAGSI